MKTSTTNFCRILLWFPLLIFNFAMHGQVNESQIRQKITELNSLITTAESQSIDATRERMSVRVAEVFLVHAAWDENNKSVNEAKFENINVIPYNAPTQYTATQLADLLPGHERSESLKLLNRAIDNLTKLIDGEITRKPTIKLDYSNMTISGSRILQDNKPVFAAEWVFRPNTSGSVDLTEFFGDFGGTHLRPTNFLSQDASGELILTGGAINRLQNLSGNFGLGFLATGTNDIPQFFRDEHPDVVAAVTQHTGFDIDHPEIRNFYAKFLELVVPYMKEELNSEIGYLLTNEPHWNVYGNWWPITPTQYTRNKFTTWLQDQHDNINQLNNRWGTNFSSFSQAGNSWDGPIDAIPKSTPRFYDILKFNQIRVAEWYQFLNNSIKAHDSDAKTNIKLIPNHWSQNGRQHGLDFEKLTEMSGVIGNDANTADMELWRGATPDYWKDVYTIEWRNMAISYDFMSSVNPNVINYNSESGFTGWVRYRNLFQDPSYVRCAYWLAVMQGMDLVNTWAWGRDKNAAPIDRWGPGLVDQMPQVLNETHLTMFDLSANGEEVSLIQDMKRPIRIFYSETAAINDENYMEDNIQELYDDFYFEGYKIGFATANIINNQNNRDWDVIVVKDAERVTDAEFQSLQQYLNNGGTIIIDSNSLTQNQYGENRSETLNQSGGTLIVSGDDQLKTNALNKVQSQLVLDVTETNSQGSEFKGVMHRAIRTSDGENVITLVNLGIGNANINLSIPGYNGNITITNMLNGKSMDNGFSMKTEDVLLLKVDRGGNSTGVTVYKNCNYNGTNATFAEGTYSFSDFVAQFPSNQLSSIRVPSGYKATLYQNDLSGNILELISDDACLIDNDFNDETSSIKIELISNGVTVYSDCNYGGESATFSVGTYPISDFVTKFPNDELSSIRVQSGYKATLYEHGGPSGASLELINDNSCLIDNGFNDITSSIKIELAPNGSENNGRIQVNGKYTIKNKGNNQNVISPIWDNFNARMYNSVTVFSDHRWEFVHLGEDRHTIRNEETGRYLEVINGECSNDANVKTWTNADSDHQKWYIERKNDNIFLIPVHCTSRALDKNSGDDGDIHLWNRNNNNVDQQFELIPEDNRSKTGDLSQLNIFPNPANNKLNIDLSKSPQETLEYSILNLVGQTLIKGKFNDHRNDIETIDVSSLQNGIYLIKVVNYSSSYNILSDKFLILK